MGAQDTMYCLFCRIRWDDRTRPLWLAFVGNTVFTSAQVVGATFANSLAMSSDTSTMFVDSVTYLVSLIAEHQRARCGPRGAQAAELGASAFSVIALFAVTVFVAHDAVERVYGGEEEEDVDPAIMLGFTIVNLFVDFFMCAPFVRHVVRRRRRRRFPTEVSLAQVQASSAQPGSPECRVTPYSAEPAAADATADGDGIELNASKELNLVSAYAHVFADTLRTLTVLTCAVLVYASPSISPATADAVGALIVSGIILVVVLYLGYETVCQLRAFLAVGAHSAAPARTSSDVEPRVSGTAPADAV